MAKKVIRLTESDLTRIVKRTIEEQSTPPRGMGMKDPEITSGEFLDRVKKSSKRTGTCTFDGTNWKYNIDGVEYKHIETRFKNPGFNG